MTKLTSVCLLVITLLACTASRKNTDEGKGAADNPAQKSVLKYINSISGKRTIAGIHNREPNAEPARWTNEIFNTTGKYPGLWSGDFLFQAENIANRKTMIDEALRQWKKGSVVNIMWHACNPALEQPCGWDNKGVKSKLSDTQWKELLTEGTLINKRWKEMMDEVAAHLQFLEDNGVEVLWRPLHEMNQGVFWWGGRPDPEGTRKLWQQTHDYLSKTKGLNNLIWVWDIQDFATLKTDAVNYNPGPEYWDIAALDVYDDKSGYSAEKYNIMLQAAGDKPIAIGECQKYPTAAQLAAQPRWTFFMGWSELVFSSNSKDQLNALIQSPNIVTLDQMPGWTKNN